MEFIRDLSLAIIVATDVLAYNDAIPTPAGRAQVTQIYLFFISVIIENQFMLTKPYYSKLVDDTSRQFLNFDISMRNLAFRIPGGGRSTHYQEILAATRGQAQIRPTVFWKQSRMGLCRAKEARDFNRSSNNLLQLARNERASG